MNSKIGTRGWIMLYVTNGFIDVVQLFAVPIEAALAVVGIGVGLAVLSEAADPFIGATLLAWLQYRGVDVIHKPKRWISLLGVTGVEFVTDGIAPFWIVDIWYIHSDVRKEAKMEQASAQISLIQDGVRRAGNAGTPPMIQNGRRAPNQTAPSSEQAAETNATKKNLPDIDSMTADKEQWERELQGLEPQLKALIAQNKESSVQYLKLQMAVTEKQKQGAGREEVDEARKIASAFLASTRRNDDQMHQMQEKADVLKNQIWDTNNKIIEEKIRVKEARGEFL